MSRVFFNLLAAYLLALLLALSAGVVLIFTVHPGPEALRQLTNRQFGECLLQYLILFLPLAAVFPPAFAFLGLHDTEGKPQSSWIAPVVGFILLSLAISVVGQFLVADALVRLKVEALWKSEERALSQAVRDASNLEELESRWKRDPIASSAKVLGELEALGKDFPFHLDLFRLMDRIRREETLQKLQAKEPKRAGLLTGMETRAEEARNRRDWATATLLYGKLIEQVPPGRPFLTERKRLEAARDAVLALEADPASKRTEAEIREIRFREELTALDGDFAAGRMNEAFLKSRDLMLLYGRRDEVKDRYQKAEATLRREEFLVQDYRLRQRFLTNAPALGKTVFHLGDWTIAADRFSWSMDFVYLEGVWLTQGKSRWGFKYARAQGDHILLKNGEEKSLTFTVPGLGAVLDQALLLLPIWHRELWFVSPLALEKYRLLVTQNLSQPDRFWRFLREAKWFLPGWIFALCLFLTGLAWWNREHLVDPLYLLALLFLIPLGILLFLGASYVAAWQSMTLGVTAMRVALAAACVLLAAASLLFIARVK